MIKYPVITAFALGIFSVSSIAQSPTKYLRQASVDRDPVDVTQLQSLLSAKRPTLTFRVDDILSIQVAGILRYAEKQRVDDDGTILFPLIGKIQVAGLTVQQLQASVITALQQGGMVRDPQVTVTIEARPSEVVSVLGNVQKPGVFPAVGNLTIADYIGQAQGFVETISSASPANSPADLNVILIRPSLGHPVKIPLGPDKANSAWRQIPIFAGDQIQVNKIGVVYAVGAFKTQGGYPLKNTRPTTVIELIGLAGGVGYEAASGASHLVRFNGDSTTVLDLDISKILKGTAPDVALESEDILFVPTNKLKAAIKGGGTGLVVTLASSYLLYKQ